MYINVYHRLGKDGTRAYVTGKFDEEGLIDDVSGFEDNQMMEIENWIKFYDETYVFKGAFMHQVFSECSIHVFTMQCHCL